MKKANKIVIGIIIGVFVALTIDVTAETLIGSEGVSYSNSKTAETTVDGALDELFSAVQINDEVAVLKQSIADLESKYSALAEASISLDKVYPVGSVYISVSATNPGSIVGGTWVAFGSGRTLVGVNTSNTNFNTVEKTGGSTTAALSTNNLPSHTHSIPALSGTAASTGSGYSIGYGSASRITSNAGNHNHTSTNNQYFVTTTNSAAQVNTGVANGHHNISGYVGTTSTAGDHSHTVADYYATSISGVAAHTHTVTTKASTSGATGSGSAFSVQDPYITVYMWKRTA